MISTCQTTDRKTIITFINKVASQNIYESNKEGIKYGCLRKTVYQNGNREKTG